MDNIDVVCPECGAVNSMEDFAVIKKVMHEKCTNCGHTQELPLVRCLKRMEDDSVFR